VADTMHQHMDDNRRSRLQLAETSQMTRASFFPTTQEEGGKHANCSHQ
jgi:hypothetical protein